MKRVLLLASIILIASCAPKKFNQKWLKAEAPNTFKARFETTKGIVKELGLEEGKYRNSFQSRLLKDPWLKPYTDFELEAMPEQGIKKLAVITPAFVADCLETLEEIAMEGKEELLAFGGEEFRHISCLNEDDAWVDVMVQWINNWNS